MNSGQALDAGSAIRDLERASRAGGNGRTMPPLELWRSFKMFLQRRGYYVSTPQQVAQSLAEIRDVGAGFDLYELACALAHYDMTSVECLGVGRRRRFPELRPFAVKCDCDGHHESVKST